MSKFTRQMEKWKGKFGKEYTNRNVLSLEEMELLYKRKYEITRTEMNLKFLGELNRCISILEIGSNIGNQLICLQKIGFKKLYGIELQEYAIELSKVRTKNINIIQGSAFEIPFKRHSLDLVFTSGLLIHISPLDINEVLAEIHRCTRDYIWGFEYYSDKYTEANYRGHTELLWKTNFANLYRACFNDLELIQEEHYKYLDNDNIDSMFLLRKRKIDSLFHKPEEELQ